MHPTRRSARAPRRPAPRRTTRIRVGTSGWTYADWTGPFYPEDVTGADRLNYYAERFDTVEINSTFYSMPFTGMITGWNRRLPPGFHLVVKGSRVVTHFRKLVGFEKALNYFFDRMADLRRLKVVLWQLPPVLRKDIERLDRFLSALPRTVRHAVEFRHASWWDDDTVATLRAHRAAFVSISHPALPGDAVASTNLLYLRFHGLGPRLYDYDYSRAELLAWADKVRPLLPGRSLYAFFNNDYRARAPLDAAQFRGLLA